MGKLFSKKTLGIFDYFLIIGVTTLTLAYSILMRDFNVIGIVAAITGLINVVLVAKGNILNYAFGLVNVTLYAIISFNSHLYGDAALYALYYLPMQFIGWFSWKNRGQKEEEAAVKGERMNSKLRITWGGISIVGVVILSFILKYFGDAQPLNDAATTVLSIIAMFLMVRAYMEQWVLWIVINIISVVKWGILSAQGEEFSVIMVIMWIFYLANSINGFRVWYRLSNSSEN